MPRLLVSALALLYTLSADAAADSHDQRKAAAYAAFEVGRYTEAIGHFEAAYRLKRDPRLLYNIGLAYYRRHELTQAFADLRQARNLFRRFLALVPPPRRAGGDAAKVVAARRFARRYVRRIDLALARRTTTARAVSATTMPATTMPATTRPAAVVSSEKVRLLPSTPAIETGATPAETERDSSSAHWWLYGLAGLAGTAATITGGLALSADASSDDLAARRDREANAAAGRSRDLALSTDLLLGVAVVSAVVGAVLHYRARRHASATR